MTAAQPSTDASFNPADLLDAGVLKQVRSDITALTEMLADAQGEIMSVHAPAVDAAAIADWVSTARISYDLIRTTLHGMLETAGAACLAVEWQYETLLILLDGQILLAEGL